MYTTLTLNPVMTVDNYNNNSRNNSNSNNQPAYYDTEEDNENAFLLPNETHYSDSYIAVGMDDALLLDRMTRPPTTAHSPSLMFTPTATTTTTGALQKSHSYHGNLSGGGATLKTKATILKQDSLNGRIATSLTTDNDSLGTPTLTPTFVLNDDDGDDDVVDTTLDGIDEHEPFLSNGNNNNNSSINLISATTTTRRNTARNYTKSRNSFCTRAHAFINRNWYLSYLVPLSILLALMFVAYLTRNYAKRLLYWIETQNPWVIFALFMFLFVVVSFPIVIGYFVLMITAGYLFGCVKGFLTVILGAHLGIAVAHWTLRSFRHRIPMHRLIKNETGRAILRVISGPRAFKVVLFTRLTPIPFGIQNAIFGVSSINPRIYHSATLLGLLPAQTINVYLGSTLRSMHEVLNNHGGTAVTGYISFGVEVICGVALMFWVVQKARKELSETLLSDITNEGKLIDIQV